MQKIIIIILVSMTCCFMACQNNANNNATATPAVSNTPTQNARSQAKQPAVETKVIKAENGEVRLSNEAAKVKAKEEKIKKIDVTKMPPPVIMNAKTKPVEKKKQN